MRYIDNIVRLRQKLHRYPELAGEEKKTSNILRQYLEQYNPDELVMGIAGHGLACTFKARNNVSDKKILFRADLDALAIEENTDDLTVAESCSVHQGLSHKCGHDGHMAMVAGLAPFLEENRDNGVLDVDVTLFFQPAEETGEGAKASLESPYFQQRDFDHVFAVHNIPQGNENHIFISPKTFSCASRGIKIELIGKTAHAAEPLNAISPLSGIRQLIDFSQKSSSINDDDQYALMTITHLEMGEKNFGTTPGQAHIYLTLRAISDQRLEQVQKELTIVLAKIKKESHIDYELSYHDIFPALVNNQQSFELVKKAADKINQNYTEMNFPFKWSEDFSYFTKHYSGCYWGVGLGRPEMALHHQTYEFNDNIIEGAIKHFLAIISIV